MTVDIPKSLLVELHKLEDQISLIEACRPRDAGSRHPYPKMSLSECELKLERAHLRNRIVDMIRKQTASITAACPDSVPRMRAENDFERIERDILTRFVPTL